MSNSRSKGMIYDSGHSFNRDHILGLDALRTLAIVGVTLFHIFPDVVKGGYLGVSLFFVLTGYLLAFTSKKEWQAKSFSLVNYYLKRIKRIYPSLLIVIFTTLGIYHFFATDAITGIRAEVISIVLGYNNWWQIAQNADYFTRITNASPFTHLWFMGIELQYYLVWPIIFLVYILIVKIRGKYDDGVIAIALLGIAASILMPLLYHEGADITRLYYGTDTRVYALFFGAAMGLYNKNERNITTRRGGHGIFKCGLFVFLLIGVITAYYLMDGQDAFVYQGGMLLATVGFCVLLSIVADRGMNIGIYLDTAIFRWIGKKSYGIFLWQYPVIYLFNYKGWNKYPLYEVIEIAAIVLLAIWSDAVAKFILKQKLPYIGRRFVIIQCVVFMVITVSGVSLMGYGCEEIVASAFSRDVDTKLQDKLAENKADMQEQNGLSS